MKELLFIFVAAIAALCSESLYEDYPRRRAQ